MMASFSLFPATICVLFPQNREQGAAAARCPSAGLCMGRGGGGSAALPRVASSQGKALGTQPVPRPLTPQPGQSPQGMTVRSQPLRNPTAAPSPKGYHKCCAWWGTGGFWYHQAACAALFKGQISKEITDSFCCCKGMEETNFLTSSLFPK